jgi:hypothetical protein
MCKVQKCVFKEKISYEKLESIGARHTVTLITLQPTESLCSGALVRPTHGTFLTRLVALMFRNALPMGRQSRGTSVVRSTVEAGGGLQDPPPPNHTVQPLSRVSIGKIQKPFSN